MMMLLSYYFSVSLPSPAKWERERVRARIQIPHVLRFTSSSLPNDFIRPHQHIRRNRQTDLLGCFQVDHELKLRWLLHGKIGGLGAFEDLVHVSSRAAILVGIVRPICLAAFRLITNSNFVGCSTGRSAGLAPLRILST